MDNEDNVEVSDCCGAEIYENTDICSDCKEHCGVQEWDELDDTPEEMNEHLRSIGYWYEWGSDCDC